MVDIRRRELITLIGGVAGVAPPSTCAATAGKFPQIGFLHSATPEAYALMTAAFRKSLSEAGNVTIECRWAAGRPGQGTGAVPKKQFRCGLVRLL
jgi:hypothetical protein